ncbi:MAG: DUF1552 domain-containing protein [Myxococcales bacterium]
MMSYRFKRRSFLQGLGGAVGLKIMLRNLEASAAGAKSPPRMLVTHWPVGIVETGWAPTSGSVGGSVIMKGFANHGLANDMTVFRGFSTTALSNGGMGGGHEAGTVKLMTGVGCPGTRGGLPEGDDAFSGGPSYDQIFLKNVPALSPGDRMATGGYANSIADSRVDFLETSTQCLSYGYSQQGVASTNTNKQENLPLLPVLSPVQQWMNLFKNYIPGTPPGTGAGGAGGGTGTGTVNTAMLKALNSRKSVLDFCVNELNQLKTLAPASEVQKIMNHTDAIRQAEVSILNQLDYMRGMGGGSGAGGSGGGGGGGGGGACVKPASPDPAITGKTYGNMSMNNYSGKEATTIEDGPTHARVAQVHMDILKAAMVCDLIRVGTFQYSPGTNHVSFKGMYPGEPNTIYMHHPLSHRIGSAQTRGTLGPEAQFLANALAWYYELHASIMAGWKTTLDGNGNSLLDTCVVPFVTEVQATGHEWNDMAAMIIGGSKLGFTHGTFKTGNWPIQQYWGTVAQAFGLGPSVTPSGAIGAPIPGCWTAPPA